MAVTQQAVSERVAALERDLGVRLFTRDARGARLTVDGQAFLPHARALLRAEEQAVASVRRGTDPRRVALSRRSAAHRPARPDPGYPHSLLCRADNPHPALAVLRAHLGTAGSGGAHRNRAHGARSWTPQPGTWTPERAW